MNHFDPSSLPEVEIRLSEDVLETLVISENVHFFFPIEDVSKSKEHAQLPPTRDHEWGSFSHWASTGERYKQQLSSLASTLRQDLGEKHHKRPRTVWIHQAESKLEQ